MKKSEIVNSRRRRRRRRRRTKKDDAPSLEPTNDHTHNSDFEATDATKLESFRSMANSFRPPPPLFLFPCSLGPWIVTTTLLELALIFRLVCCCVEVDIWCILRPSKYSSFEDDAPNHDTVPSNPELLLLPPPFFLVLSSLLLLYRFLSSLLLALFSSRIVSTWS